METEGKDDELVLFLLSLKVLWRQGGGGTGLYFRRVPPPQKENSTLPYLKKSQNWRRKLPRVPLKTLTHRESSEERRGCKFSPTRPFFHFEVCRSFFEDEFQSESTSELTWIVYCHIPKQAHFRPLCGSQPHREVLGRCQSTFPKRE